MDENFTKIPNLILWKKDKKYNYISMNDNLAQLLGPYNSKDLIGITDYDLPGKISNSAKLFRSQDRNIMLTGNSLMTIEVNLYRHIEPRVIITITDPLFNLIGKIIGINGRGIDITEWFIQTYYLLISTTIDPLSIISMGSHTINQNVINKNLNRRQLECLCFLLKGKTIKQIGKQLRLSPRTIEDYLTQLKEKFNCHSKNELITNAIEDGFLNIIPEHFASFNLLNIFKNLV